MCPTSEGLIVVRDLPAAGLSTSAVNRSRDRGKPWNHAVFYSDSSAYEQCAQRPILHLPAYQHFFNNPPVPRLFTGDIHGAQPRAWPHLTHANFTASMRRDTNPLTPRYTLPYDRPMMTKKNSGRFERIRPSVSAGAAVALTWNDAGTETLEPTQPRATSAGGDARSHDATAEEHAEQTEEPAAEAPASGPGSAGNDGVAEPLHESSSRTSIKLPNVTDGGPPVDGQPSPTPRSKKSGMMLRQQSSLLREVRNLTSKGAPPYLHSSGVEPLAAAALARRPEPRGTLTCDDIAGTQSRQLFRPIDLAQMRDSLKIDDIVPRKASTATRKSSTISCRDIEGAKPAPMTFTRRDGPVMMSLDTSTVPGSRPQAWGDSGQPFHKGPDVGRWPPRQMPSYHWTRSPRKTGFGPPA